METEHVPIQTLQPAFGTVAADPRVDKVELYGGVKKVEHTFETARIGTVRIEHRFDLVVLFYEALKAPLRDAVAQKGDGNGGVPRKTVLFFANFIDDFHSYIIQTSAGKVNLLTCDLAKFIKDKLRRSFGSLG